MFQFFKSTGRRHWGWRLQKDKRRNEELKCGGAERPLRVKHKETKKEKKTSGIRRHEIIEGEESLILG